VVFKWVKKPPSGKNTEKRQGELLVLEGLVPGLPHNKGHKRPKTKRERAPRKHTPTGKSRVLGLEERTGRREKGEKGGSVRGKGIKSRLHVPAKTIAPIPQ